MAAKVTTFHAWWAPWSFTWDVKVFLWNSRRATFGRIRCTKSLLHCCLTINSLLYCRLQDLHNTLCKENLWPLTAGLSSLCAWWSAVLECSWDSCCFFVLQASITWSVWIWRLSPVNHSLKDTWPADFLHTCLYFFALHTSLRHDARVLQWAYWVFQESLVKNVVCIAKDRGPEVLSNQLPNSLIGYWAQHWCNRYKDTCADHHP